MNTNKAQLTRTHYVQNTIRDTIIRASKRTITRPKNNQDEHQENSKKGVII